MQRASLLVLLGALLFLPANASAQSEWEQQVRQQIEAAREVFSPDGYALVGDTKLGTLDKEDSDDFNLTLESGVSYILVGVCDNDCPDIDLMLLDNSGNEIDKDYEDDAVPMVEVTPPRTAGTESAFWPAAPPRAPALRRPRALGPTMAGSSRVTCSSTATSTTTRIPSRERKVKPSLSI
jgi:hypothetical protein